MTAQDSSAEVVPASPDSARAWNTSPNVAGIRSAGSVIGDSYSTKTRTFSPESHGQLELGAAIVEAHRSPLHRVRSTSKDPPDEQQGILVDDVEITNQVLGLFGKRHFDVPVRIRSSRAHSHHRIGTSITTNR